MTEEEKLQIEDLFNNATVDEWAEMAERIGDVATMRDDESEITATMNELGVVFTVAYCTRRKRPV